jgi:hypothetical protein
LAISGALGLAPSAAVAAPVLSGSYLTAISFSCQAVVTVDSNTGLLAFKNDNALGSTGGGPGTLTFDFDTGAFNQAGISYGMSSIFEDFTNGGKKGRRADSGAISASGTYSNTDTTLTLTGGGATSVYDVVYGSVDQSNVAHAFVATTKYDKDRCIFTVQAQSQ